MSSPPAPPDEDPHRNLKDAGKVAGAVGMGVLGVLGILLLTIVAVLGVGLLLLFLACSGH